MRDLDLAAKLGYAQPRDIRKIISRMVEDGRLPGIQQRATVARYEIRPGVMTERAVDEYLLTEAQALMVIAKSETDTAHKLLGEVIAVYMAWRHGRLAPVAAPVATPPAMHPNAIVKEITTTLLLLVDWIGSLSGAQLPC